MGGTKWAVAAAAIMMFIPKPTVAEALEGRKSSAEILNETAAKDWRQIRDDELLIIKLEHGEVLVALSPELAPAHVKQIRKLAKEHFYDGLSFYRVIDGFVAQGGDPFSDRDIGGAKKALKGEFETTVGDKFNFDRLPDKDGYAPEVGFLETLPVGFDPRTKTAWHLHCAGAFAFGRENDADTASTEFYIALQPQRYLDRNLSVFGRVIDGMEYLQALRRVNPPETRQDDLGAKIVSIRMASDLPKEERPHFEILDSRRPVFADYVAARRNRPEAFFYFRPDYIDICQLPIPVRRVGENEQ